MPKKSASKKTIKVSAENKEIVIETLPSASMPSPTSKLSNIRKFLSPSKDKKSKKGEAKKSLKQEKVKYQSTEGYVGGSSGVGGTIVEDGKSSENVQSISAIETVAQTNVQTIQRHELVHEGVSSTFCDIQSCANLSTVTVNQKLSDPVKHQEFQRAFHPVGSSVGSCSPGRMSGEDESRNRMVQTNLSMTKHGVEVMLSPQKVQKKKGKKTNWNKKEEPTKNQTKITSIFPARKSNRKTKYQQEREEEARITKAILSKSFEGLEVRTSESKGRGVFATRDFQRSEFVCEYSGELISHVEAKKREKKYGEDGNIGCYMYYLESKNRKYCIDATAEDGTLGRLINHSRSGNCKTRVHIINNQPHLIFIATCHVKAGEEFSYDYGDRSKDALDNHPWLKF